MVGLYFTPKICFSWENSWKHISVLLKNINEPVYRSVTSAEYSASPGCKFCTSTSRCGAVGVTRTVVIAPFLEEPAAAVETWTQPRHVHEKMLLSAFLVLKECKWLGFKLPFKKAQTQRLTTSSASVKPWVLICTSSAHQPNVNQLWNWGLAGMPIGAVFTLCRFGPEILAQYYFWSMQHCQCAIFIWNSLTGKRATDVRPGVQTGTRCPVGTSSSVPIHTNFPLFCRSALIAGARIRVYLAYIDVQQSAMGEE